MGEGGAARWQPCAALAELAPPTAVYVCCSYNCFNGVRGTGWLGMTQSVHSHIVLLLVCYVVAAAHIPTGPRSPVSKLNPVAVQMFVAAGGPVAVLKVSPCTMLGMLEGLHKPTAVDMQGHP